ncbi:DUF2157 domain-containing protein [Sphingosinicella terrae]|uniref:DUF2157 domain-containing protein n=1 Tax=Sphingosinicella terrae TaxID=2172047 RepID=UPI0013B3697F|nr:DUF2157 domain-containing protein [Sphingosinicella terrae]
MSRYRSFVLDWFDAGRVVPGREAALLRAAGVAPGRADWRAFLTQLTLWLGTLALAFAVIFFFAFNWEDLGRFAKFGLVEAAIVAGLGGLWWLGLERAAGKAMLVLLSLLAGALLALAGQTYQTGADTYELFGWWALLILPWVLVGRFSPLWLFWLGLINLTIWLYFQTGFETRPSIWALFALNALALLAWEIGHRAGLAWLRDSWPPRLVAMASAGMATALIVWTIAGSDDDGGGDPLGVLAYLAWLGALYGWYRLRRPDLFMLAAGVLSLIIAVVTYLVVRVIEEGPIEFLFVGLVVIGLSAAGGMWLRSVARAVPA